MKKKVQAIIKKIRLAALIPLGFTLIVLLGCYFFVHTNDHRFEGV